MEEMEWVREEEEEEEAGAFIGQGGLGWVVEEGRGGWEDWIRDSCEREGGRGRGYGNLD